MCLLNYLTKQYNMGTFLASNFKIVDGTINVYGASSNLRPLYFCWATYDSYESFFYDLISGMTSFRYSNKTSDRINAIISNIEAEHITKYPHAKEGILNSYGLYSMLRTHNKDKEEYLMTANKHLSYYEQSFQDEKKKEIAIYKENWDEFKSHVDALFNKFKTSMQSSFDKKQTVLELL